ncbi:MAG: hypothetical protein Kow0067_11050 [Coriobacteriia bacterium]
MGMLGAMFGRKTPVARVTVALTGERSGTVETWYAADERQEVAYQTILLFLMYYARSMFFLSFRDTANELLSWMEHATEALASAQEGEKPEVSRDWTLAGPDAGEHRTVYVGELLTVGPGEYLSKFRKPVDVEDVDVQGTVLLYLQSLVDALPAVERAYLTLSLVGMHEYYTTVQHWNTTKSIHPAPAYGMRYARTILERPQS